MTCNHGDILLIEDSDEHAELTKFFISEYRKDINVVWLSDGGKVMEYIESIRNSKIPMPWLCLLDLQLPRYDGHELIAVIKSDALLARMPVVIFTTSASKRDICRAANNHANSFVIKPMGPDQYGKAIESILSYWELDQYHWLSVE